MLNASQFAVNTGCPKELPQDVAEFAMFQLHDLWAIKPQMVSLTQLKSKQRQEEKEARSRRLAQWIRQGFAFDSRAATDPSGCEDINKDNDTPQDEWSHFWGGASPTETCGRK